MARAYLDDLRERVAGVLSGGSEREVASAFGVSAASVLQRLRETVGGASERQV